MYPAGAHSSIASPASRSSRRCTGSGRDTGVDIDRLWEAADVIDEHIGDEPVAPTAPRIAVRAAEYDLPASLVAALDLHLRVNAAGDRLLDALDELRVIREEAGSPPLAAPIGEILATQAKHNILFASRYMEISEEFQQLIQGGYGVTPGPIDPEVDPHRRAARHSAGRVGREPAVRRGHRRRGRRPRRVRGGPRAARDVRREGEAPARDDPGAAHSGTASLIAGDVEATRAERIREIVKIVQESGVGEIEIEDEGMRVSVRKADETPAPVVVPAAAGGRGHPRRGASSGNGGLLRIESPMPGVFYRAADPGSPPFVAVGDVVHQGQTLCLIEAMKLFNELKADQDGLVRSIHVDNAQPVEYGQLLFELEPVVGPPTL